MSAVYDVMSPMIKMLPRPKSCVTILFPSFSRSLAVQGKEVSQESVKQFYENWMSRQNTLSSQDDLDDSLPPPSSPPTASSSRHAYAKLRNQASKVSWGSSISR